MLTKKPGVAGFAIVAFAFSLGASAIAAPRSPAAAPAMSWSGCYVGVNAGYGWGGDSVASGGVPEGDPRFGGALGGAQIGCDYQFAGPVVIGIEGMYDFADLRGDAVDPASPLGGPSVTTSSRYKALADFTGRIGYAVDRFLFYIKGGFAWSRSERSSASPVFSQHTGNTSKFGWVIGGGWEYMFAPRWSAKVEYNHFDFGRFNESVVQQPGGAVFQQEDRNKGIDVVLIGLNYRFYR